MNMKTTFGVIVGNRGFFPDHLIKTGHKKITALLKKAGYGCVTLDQEATPGGAVENHAEARKCADLFKAHADEIDGIIITLPNFGDERAAANSVRWSGLDVPVLVQAEPDKPDEMSLANRRDSFCGKISICNNLHQYGIPFSLTARHCEAVDSEEFARDLDLFAAVCRVVRSLRRVRLGAIGARTGPFNTVRYSEKILERAGVTVETLDLSEMLMNADKLAGSKEAKAKGEALRGYVACEGVSDEAFERMSRLAAATDMWVAENDLQGIALQCWTAIEQIYGIVPCAMMSMLSNSGIPAACEVDITGTLSMYALQAASGVPSAIVDWNNNYGDDPDKCVAFHCSNLPRDVFEQCRMSFQAIIAGDIGKENAFGSIEGRIKSAPATFCRISTDDTDGLIRAYVGEGRFTDDALETFGGYGVLEVPGLQTLLRYICRMGFEHHTAVNLAHCAEALCQAMSTYLDYDVYHHA